MQSFIPKDTTCYLQEARENIGFGAKVPSSAIVKEVFHCSRGRSEDLEQSQQRSHRPFSMSAAGYGAQWLF